MSKSFYSLILVLWSINFTLQAQTSKFSLSNAQFGIKGGINAGVLIGPIKEGDSGAPVIGPKIGFTGIYPFGKNYGVQADLSYCYTGVKFSTHQTKENEMRNIEFAGSYNELPVSYSADASGKIGLHYIDIPLKLLLKMNNKVSYFIGPRFAFLIDGHLEGEATNVKLGYHGFVVATIEREDFPASDIAEFENNLRFMDFGLTGGCAIRFGHLIFSPELSCGLTSVNYKGTLLPDNYYNLFLTSSVEYRF